MNRFAMRMLCLMLCAVLMLGALPAARATEAVPSTESIAAEATVPETEPALEETTVPEETEPQDPDPVPVSLEGSFSLDGPADNEERFDRYLEDILYEGIREPVPYGYAAGENLEPGSKEKKLYDFLRPKIEHIAEHGGYTDAFVFKPSDFGIDKIYYPGSYYNEDGSVNPKANEAFWAGLPDFDTVMRALALDCPYDLYWWDQYGKNSWMPECQILIYQDYNYIKVYQDTITFKLKVNPIYGSQFEVKADPVARAKKAAANAANIVAQNANKSDYEKLKAYKEKICELVSYDSSKPVASANKGPWSIINTFDGDPNTNVVCGGYAVSFQYICDLSTFRDHTLRCISVLGDLTSSYSGNLGYHEWNIVCFRNKNYLVDLTNCDEGTSGYPDYLFMKAPISGSSRTEYRFKTQNPWTGFIYDSKMFDLYTEEQLTLTFEPLDQNTPDPTTFPVYRMYNPTTHEHLLVSSSQEKRTLLNGGWSLDGIVFNAPFSGTPVYRVYNPIGDWHFYTSSLQELRTVQSWGWSLDGIVLNAVSQEEGIPVHRLRNAYEEAMGRCFHHYATAQAEVDSLIEAGWIYEGVAWYALA